MKWTEYKIKNLGRVVTGKTPSTSQREFFGGVYLFVTPTDLNFNHYFIEQTNSTISEVGREKHKNQFLPPNSVMFTCIGNTIGKIALNHEPCLTNQQINSIIPFDDFDFKFIYYNLINKIPEIKILGGGVATPIVNKSTFEEVRLNVPPLPTQQKIAAILSAYDDLIENNLRRIRLLEEAAQHLYLEWFVRFRFPGWEEVRVVDGLPEGWERKVIKDFGEVVTGKTPSTENLSFYSGQIPFVKTPDMHSNVFVISTVSTLSTAGADSQKNKYLPALSVLVSCIGTAGVVSLAADTCQTNQQINAIVLDKDYKSFYAYFFSKGLKEHLEGLGSNGATFVNVNKNKFENIEIVIPTEDLLIEFGKIVQPIFSQILTLLKQNQKLKEARDILLPRLMNQTIEV